MINPILAYSWNSLNVFIDTYSYRAPRPSWIPPNSPRRSMGTLSGDQMRSSKPIVVSDRYLHPLLWGIISTGNIPTCKPDRLHDAIICETTVTHLIPSKPQRPIEQSDSLKESSRLELHSHSRGYAATVTPQEQKRHSKEAREKAVEKEILYQEKAKMSRG